MQRRKELRLGNSNDLNSRERLCSVRQSAWLQTSSAGCHKGLVARRNITARAECQDKTLTSHDVLKRCSNDQNKKRFTMLQADYNKNQ